MGTFKIIRVYRPRLRGGDSVLGPRSQPSKVILTGLTLEAAKAHIRKGTESRGWFDSYEE